MQNKITEKKQSFINKLRYFFWPIENKEVPKFMPMAGLMFCILFSQNILRILKDSILISEISAEITSFTKIYVVAPAAALFVVVYSYMVNNSTFDKIFYKLISSFTIFFAIFAFVIYPNTDLFHMQNDKLLRIMDMYPNFKWYIALIANWSYVIFYTLSELWPNIFYILLFWQLANDITTTGEAKRFYTLLALFGNSSLIFVGLLMSYLSSDNNFITKYITSNVENKILLVQSSTILVIISTILSIFLVRFIFKNVLSDPNLYVKAKSERDTKEKLSLIESFRYIAKSKYLWLMLICSASFGLAMNLVEAVWKSKIKELHSTVNSYAAFNSKYILWTGVAILIMTVLGNNIIRAYNWLAVAIISPIIIAVTGTAFFILIVFDEQIISLLGDFVTLSPLALVVFIGTIQNVFAKGSKYSLWDTSREMLYIPLDNEMRTKGKAAVDVISSKIGKSSSGFLQSIIFTLIPTATYTSISPLLMTIFIIVCVVWICVVNSIYKEYSKIA